MLREDLQMTGAKYGCGEGQCRACTVLINGKAVASCLTPVAEADTDGKNCRFYPCLTRRRPQADADG